MWYDACNPRRKNFEIQYSIEQITMLSLLQEIAGAGPQNSFPRELPTDGLDWPLLGAT